MTSVVQPVVPGTSDDPKINELIQQAIDGWWHDSAMLGAISHQPDLLKTYTVSIRIFFYCQSYPSTSI